MKAPFILSLIAAISTLSADISYQLSDDFKELVTLYYDPTRFSLDNYKQVNVAKMGKYYIDHDFISGKKKDGIKTWLAKGVAWEEDIFKIISNCVKKGTVVLDIGSHIGTHTVGMSRLVGPEGLVVAFEPQRKIYFELVHNIEANGCQHNTICLPFAVGDQPQLAYMQPVEGNEGGAGLCASGEECPVITVDSLNLTNVSFIKMDVESYEDFALDGAKETITRCKPIMIIEILGGMDPKKAPKEMLKKRDATVKKIQSLGYIVRQVSAHDYLAIPKK